MNEALLRLPEVLARTGYARSSLYASMMAGAFPRPLKRGCASVWVESEVEEAIQRDIARLPRMGKYMGPREAKKKKPLESVA